MSFSIPNKVKPGDDIAVWSSLGLVVVEGISSRGKACMNNQVEIFLEDSISAQILPTLCDLHGLRIVYNPEMR
jgi:hypothetical protein